MRGLLAVAVVAGCYSPHLQTGSPCTTGPCPSGLVCSPATSTCELVAEPADARGQDARAVDAPGMIDARPVDAPVMIDAAIDAAGPTVPVLVQQITAHDDGGSMVSATLPATPIAGHVLVMVGGEPAGPLTDVTGAAPTWTLVTGSGVNVNIEIWYAVADGSGATVTIGRLGADSPNSVWVGEWTGLVTPPVIDGAISNAGTASPADSMPLAIPGVRDLAIFGVADRAPNTFGTPAPGAWTAGTPIISTTVDQTVWSAIASGGATLHPTVSETQHFWDTSLAAFRIAP